MNKHTTIFFIFALILFAQKVDAKVYECTYQDRYGNQIVSSYNTLVASQPNHKELIMAFKRGDCKELIIKRYFLDGTICNIQFYKHNKKIGNLTCNSNKQSALKKLKEIAARDYGYFK